MSSLFTLQANDSGAWRNVVKGTQEQMQDIEYHTAMIASIMGKGTKWRIIDAAFGTVIGYCDAPDFVWRPANGGGAV